MKSKVVASPKLLSNKTDSGEKFCKKKTQCVALQLYIKACALPKYISRPTLNACFASILDYLTIMPVQIDGVGEKEE